MRRAPLSLLALLAATSPAAANRCYSSGGRLYCDQGCRIVDVWWQGGERWFSWSCAPPPEAIAAVGVFLVVLVVGLIAAIASDTSSTSSVTKATEEADARAAEAQRISDRLKAAAAEADRFLGR